MSRISFSGQVAIVTGAGNGLGRAYALDLAARGATVVVNDLAPAAGQPSAAQAVVDEIRAAGGEASADEHSIANPQGAAALVAATLERHGRIDVLINNAGILRTAPFAGYATQAYDDVIATNLDGSFHASRAAFAAMQRQHYGRIVMVSSCGGVFGHPLFAGYGASKAGVIGLMNCIALAGEAEGVRCNTIVPQAISRMGGDLSAEEGQRLGALFGRIGAAMEPRYVVPMVSYLASSECAVNGACYGAVGGVFSRIVIGQTRGWMGPRDAPASAEDIRAHLAEIERRTPLHETRDIADDLQRVVDQLDTAASAA